MRPARLILFVAIAGVAIRGQATFKRARRANKKAEGTQRALPADEDA